MNTETKRPRGRPAVRDELQRRLRNIYISDELWQFCAKQGDLYEVPTSRYIEYLIKNAETETRIV